MTITTRNHSISIPLPSEQRPTLLVAHSIVLRDRSLMVWCGAAEALQGHLQQLEMRRSAEAAKGLGSEVAEGGSSMPTSSLLMEQVVAAPSSQVQAEEEASAPTGSLTSEWAIAMSNAQAKTANATSLFRSNADVARPMAARLAKRHGASQLSLSLAIPSALLAAGPRAQLAIEGALGQVLKEVLPPPPS